MTAIASDASNPDTGTALAAFVGRVVPGKGEAGPVLDFPTLNLVPDREVDLAPGMYGAVVANGDLRAGAVVYVGTRPTFDDGDATSHEAHLIDPGPEAESLLDADVLEVEVRFFVRPERDFPTVQALKEQQFRDREEVRRRLPG